MLVFRSGFSERFAWAGCPMRLHQWLCVQPPLVSASAAGHIEAPRRGAFFVWRNRTVIAVDVGIGAETVTRLSPAQARKKHLQR